MTNSIDQLKNNIGLLNERDATFATSLINQQSQRDLSAKQWGWVDILNSRAVAPVAAPESINVGGFKGVFELFARASQNHSAKRLKIRLQDSDGRPVALFLPATGRYAGDVYVTNGASYTSGNSIFYGHVSSDGKYDASKMNSASITALLQELANDAAGTAAKYGKLTGSCCFCAKPLKDARSVHVGYGPVCAGRYQLPWGEDEPKLGFSDRYQELQDEYGLVVDSDNEELIRPIVNEMRQIEKARGLVPYHIHCSVYSG